MKVTKRRNDPPRRVNCATNGSNNLPPCQGGIEGGRLGRAKHLFLLPYFVAICFSGCHDPRYEEAQAVRSDRIHSLFARIEPRRERGRENVQELGNLHDRLEINRREHLHSTFDLVETREGNRKEVWRAGSNQRQWRTLFLGGHPDRIDDTYSKMFY